MKNGNIEINLPKDNGSYVVEYISLPYNIGFNGMGGELYITVNNGKITSAWNSSTFSENGHGRFRFNFKIDTSKLGLDTSKLIAKVYAKELVGNIIKKGELLAETTLTKDGKGQFNLTNNRFQGNLCFELVFENMPNGQKETKDTIQYWYTSTPETIIEFRQEQDKDGKWYFRSYVNGEMFGESPAGSTGIPEDKMEIVKIPLCITSSSTLKDIAEEKEQPKNTKTEVKPKKTEVKPPKTKNVKVEQPKVSNGKPTWTNKYVPAMVFCAIGATVSGIALVLYTKHLNKIRRGA